MNSILNLVWAQTPGPAGPGGYETLGFVAVVVIVLYFFMIRPERKRQADHKAMLDGLKKNDKVVTIGGIRGSIQNVKDDEISIKVDDAKGVCIRFSKSAIAQKIEKSGDKDSDEDGDKKPE